MANLLSHVDIVHKLGIVDQRTGVDVAGEGFCVMATNKPSQGSKLH